MNSSYSSEDLENRFGLHKAAIEGPNAATPRHADLREAFVEFATMLDLVLPPGRTKSLAFTELETASMWSHRSIAERPSTTIE